MEEIITPIPKKNFEGIVILSSMLNVPECESANYHAAFEIDVSVSTSTCS